MKVAVKLVPRLRELEQAAHSFVEHATADPTHSKLSFENMHKGFMHDLLEYRAAVRKDEKELEKHPQKVVVQAIQRSSADVSSAVQLLPQKSDADHMVNNLKSISELMDEVADHTSVSKGLMHCLIIEIRNLRRVSCSYKFPMDHRRTTADAL